MPKVRNQLLAGCRVLLVEEQHVISNELRTALRENGAELIGPIATISEAMRLVDDDFFDVALIDTNLHDSLAYAIADELVRQRIPFVFAVACNAGPIPDRFADVSRWEQPFDAGEILSDLALHCKRATNKLVPIDPKG
ncbi:response regulator [Bradyrhizobium sp. STM 3562]|uniref:response regulator n=1 Tax=Bradyrhizobium sp. STM 3562 TaxID=578924 RepID=UPI00388EFD60